MNELEDYLDYLEQHALDGGHDVNWVELEIIQTKEILSSRDEESLEKSREARCGK
jgi:hypothetical protein